MSRTLEPLGDRLLIERLDAEDKSPGGILLPDKAKEKPLEGVVLAVGPGRETDEGVCVPMRVAVRDRVLFSRYAGTEVQFSGKDYLVMPQTDVLGIIRGTDEPTEAEHQPLC